MALNSELTEIMSDFDSLIDSEIDESLKRHLTSFIHAMNKDMPALMNECGKEKIGLDTLRLVMDDVVKRQYYRSLIRQLCAHLLVVVSSSHTDYSFLTRQFRRVSKDW